MNDFVFITDLHCKSASNVRTGDFMEDICNKLQFVVNYANENGASILIGGDLFDKPSVPDIVKNKIIPILLESKNPIYSINGNHDVLFSSDELAEKTSYYLLDKANIIQDFTGTTIELDNVIISNEIPVIQRGKPQIIVFHGFLNQDDGKWTFHYQDIEAGITDKVYILLGHDHVEYEPLKFQDNIKIFRPGSFTRVTREDASMRQPKLLHIKVLDDRLVNKLVEIPARPFSEIFHVKESKVTKSQQRETYETIISQIKNANAQNMSFKEAMKMVTTDDVCDFTFNLVDRSRIERQHQNNNL